MNSTQDTERKRKVRRAALWLALLAAVFYFGFILISVVRTR
ncbi:hypothetical protein [Steroidobacter denitrificans]|nr:hypothetical protein [Steroidobacter denitrificans]